SKDVRKMKYVEAGTPGSICTKRYSISNTEFTKQAVCIASKEYQTAKIRELKSKNLSPVDYENEFNKIIDKTCLCEGLAQSVLIKNGIADKDKSDGVIICPGPNLTNFSKVVQLEEMVGHIYGRNNVIDSCKLPNLFIKELKLYLEYLKQLLNEYIKPISAKQKDILLNIKNNITSGIEYYKNLSSKFHSNYATLKDNFFENLNIIEYKLEQLFTEISLLDN
ncbi:MAG: hypothetical protein JXA68_01535, partial [Ignavibacteriales bacterium]|nr:hypothetical protein [Ignavibacteriales bacterium]